MDQYDLLPKKLYNKFYLILLEIIQNIIKLRYVMHIFMISPFHQQKLKLNLHLKHIGRRDSGDATIKNKIVSAHALGVITRQI